MLQSNAALLGPGPAARCRGLTLEVKGLNHIIFQCNDLRANRSVLISVLKTLASLSACWRRQLTRALKQHTHSWTTYFYIASHKSSTLFPSDVPVFTSNLCTKRDCNFRWKQSNSKDNSSYADPSLAQTTLRLLGGSCSLSVPAKKRLYFAFRRGNLCFDVREPQDKECFVNLKITGHTSFAALNRLHPWHFFQLPFFLWLCFCSASPVSLCKTVSLPTC